VPLGDLVGGGHAIVTGWLYQRRQADHHAVGVDTHSAIAPIGAPLARQSGVPAQSVGSLRYILNAESFET
jgi:hypothetical protein